MAECKKKWQDVQGTTKKKEAARRANARATGGGPPPVSDLRPWESAVSIQRSIISNVHSIISNVHSVSKYQVYFYNV